MCELKRCPFCGGKSSLAEAITEEGERFFSVICVNCVTGIFKPKISSINEEWSGFKTSEEAVNAWNRRVK